MVRYPDFLVLVLSVCVLLCGCGQGSGRPSTGSGVSACFPEFLAGTWKADASGWEITLDADGKIVSATGGNGIFMPVAEGRSHQDGVLQGEFVYMEFGLCHWKYDAAGRELAVEIAIDNLFMAAPGGSLEMDVQYRLTGPVSGDGRRWRASCWTTGGVDETVRLDSNDVEYEVLLFNKL